MDAVTEFLNLDLELDIDVDTDEVEVVAKGLQRQLTQYDERKLAVRQTSRQAIDQLETERAELLRKHAEAMKRIDGSIAALRTRATDEYETVCRLAASTRAALEALQS